jgi:hypothetical protein
MIHFKITMATLPRYSPHHHFGRLRPHGETSYALLLGVLVSTALVVLGASLSSVTAATEGSGQYTVNGVVPAARPTTAPVITSPSNGQTFATNPITVEGTCPDKAFVKVFSNQVMIGSVICGANRRFSLQVHLVVGQNQLTAVAVNINDDAGPVSSTVTVTLTTPPGGLGFSSELLLQTTSYYRGAPPGSELTWPFTLVGGLAPYAVTLDWGDKKQDLLSRTTAGPFDARHVYDAPGPYLGTYPLMVRAVDSAGHSAYLQVTSVVNASSAATAVGAKPTSLVTRALGMWPIWVLMVFVVVAFWLGERREKIKLGKQIEALAG